MERVFNFSVQYFDGEITEEHRRSNRDNVGEDAVINKCVAIEPGSGESQDSKFNKLKNGAKETEESDQKAEEKRRKQSSESSGKFWLEDMGYTVARRQTLGVFL